MASSTRSRRTFWKRRFTLLALTLLACVLIVPAQVLAGGPVSEKTAGLWQPASGVVPGADDKVIVPVPTVVPGADDKVIEAPPFEPLTDDKVLVPSAAAGLHPDSRAERPGPSAGAGEPAAFAWGGELRPGQRVTVHDRGIDWAGLGVALAISIASILTATVVVLRRRRGSLAHP